MNKKLYISIISLLVLSIIGVTYAFLSVVILGNDTSKVNKVTSGNLELTFDGTSTLSLSNLTPGYSSSKTFTVSNTGNRDITSYTLYFSNLINTFLNNEMTYSLSCSASSGSCDGVSNQVMGTNPATPIIVNSIAAGVTQTYTLTISFIEISSDQSYNETQRLLFEVTVNEYSYATSILSDTVQVGDWISYDAGSFTTTLSSVDGASYSLFYGNVSGRSRNDAIDCTNSLASLSTFNGWRVISIANDVVTLVSGGTPQCYKNSWNNTIDYDNLMNHDYSEYLNSTYATSASILTKSLAEANVLNASVVYDGGFFDANMSVLKAGTRYFFPVKYNTQHLLYVQSGGYIGSAGGQSYGIRPVVVLKKDLYVAGGSGTQSDPYTLGTTPQTTSSKGTLMSYWENWTNTYAMKLRTIPMAYNIVALSFATQDTTSGSVKFSLNEDLGNLLNGYTETEFKSDIQMIKARGQKVVLSIGGASGNIVVDSSSTATNFATSVEAIVDAYDLDGIDINFENTIYPTYLAEGITAISTHYGSDFIITMAPETVDIKASSSGVISGKYYDLLQLIGSIVDNVNVQLYNSGDQYGMDGNIYVPGTVDFITAELQVMKSGGIDSSKIGAIFHALSSATGYVSPSVAINGYNSFIAGGTTIGGTYVVPNSNHTYDNLTIYSIYNDRSTNFAYTKAFRELFK